MQSQHTDRARWVAVLVTIAVSGALAFGPPRLAEATAPQDTQISAGSRVEAGGVSIEAPEGWARTAGTEILTVSKGSAKLLISPPSPDKRSPKDSVTELLALFTTDPSFTGTASDVTTFTTDAGLDGASATITEADSVTALYAFGDGVTLATGQLSAASTDWSDLQEEIDAMIKTIQFSPGTTP